jgi:Fe-S cluster biogenesis protein NfuA
MQVLRVEPTPNPHAIKFVLDRSLAPGTSKEFTSAAEAQEEELAKNLFEIPGISSLFYNENYVTVTMNSDSDWHEVYRQAQEKIGAFEGGEDVAAQGATSTDLEVEDSEEFSRVQAVIQQRIMPALSADGGGLQILGFKDKTLTIRYQGACGSCPSAISGTLMAIENLLRAEVDPDISVRSA